MFIILKFRYKVFMDLSKQNIYVNKLFIDRTEETYIYFMWADEQV